MDKIRVARSQTYRASLNFFEGESGEIRAMIVDRKTFAPSVSGALYEASACHRYQSPNTFENVMRGAQALVSWSLETGFNLDARLIQGKPLDRREVENFANWLQECMQCGDMTLRRKQVDTFNGRIRAAEAMVRWFIETFCDGRGYELPRASIVDAALTTSKREWQNVKKRRVHDDIAPDLDDDTVKAIDTFLKNAAEREKPEPRWVRAYLIWRLTIEFGFRLGEILALRLQDCPTRSDPTIRVVRIEERDGPPDPRGRLAPRPKTLSRELAPILSNSPVPRLIADYQFSHRVRNVRGANGRKSRRPVLGHNYLLVSCSGAPLPRSSAFGLARSISEEVGAQFTWHLGRHAFFNRAYAAADMIDDPSVKAVRVDDLVYWGGWSDPKSLAIYSRRTRQERARSGLAAWRQDIEPLADFP